MRRTQVYLEERQVAQLRAAARAQQRTVSDVIRIAIDEKLQRSKEASPFKRGLDGAFGLWRNRRDLGTSDEYVRRLREDRRGR